VSESGCLTVYNLPLTTLSSNGTFYCPVVNGTYCAGGSIIIRCTNGIGYPGNCNDNLAGEPPLGVNPASCFQCSTTAGAAACSKNGIVYPTSGTGLGSTPFFANKTTVCNNTGIPISNGTNPGGSIINSTTPLPSSGLPAPSGNPTTVSGSASATLPGYNGTTATPSSSTGPAAPTYSPYTGGAAACSILTGTGAAVGFGALLFALGML